MGKTRLCHSTRIDTPQAKLADFGVAKAGGIERAFSRIFQPLSLVCMCFRLF